MLLISAALQQLQTIKKIRKIKIALRIWFITQWNIRELLERPYENTV